MNSVDFASKVCVSVAGTSVEELGRKVRLARALHPGFIEIRIDYLRNIASHEVQDRICRLIKGDNEILTLRSKSEGGKFSGSESERIALISRMISRANPPFVDIEVASLRAYTTEFQAVLGDSKETNLIASSHSFDGCISIAELWKRACSLQEFSKSLFAVKIVCMAQKFQDNLRILSLYKKKDSSKQALIAFCMGPLGPFSRIACVSLGSPLTYSSLPREAVAPGQIDAISMRQILSGL
ncbi:MAG TPA: type I 3-dehydroquinate dehydratase [Nitrososphaerales archaeon]|nr:type I 3-dehydroquinate dehydratase [Nitrososphaerales archaeon]